MGHSSVSWVSRRAASPTREAPRDATPSRRRADRPRSPPRPVATVEVGQTWGLTSTVPRFTIRGRPNPQKGETDMEHPCDRCGAMTDEAELRTIGDDDDTWVCEECARRADAEEFAKEADDED